MDKSAPWTILQGTIAISALSATTTGVLGILRGQEHYGFLAGAAALNSGITAAAFFSLREYVISPVLVHTVPMESYERRRRELGIGQIAPGTGSASVDEYSIIRVNKILDSAVSGVITGGLLRGWKSGRRAALSGSLTVGIAATVLQLGYNELSIQRLKYISRQRSPEMNSSPVASPQHSALDLVAEPVDEPSSWKTRVFSILGVRKMPEEEYITRLKLQRDHHLVRIKELEQKLKKEEQTKGNVD